MCLPLPWVDVGEGLICNSVSLYLGGIWGQGSFGSYNNVTLIVWRIEGLICFVCSVSPSTKIGESYTVSLPLVMMEIALDMMEIGKHYHSVSPSGEVGEGLIYVIHSVTLSAGGGGAFCSPPPQTEYIPQTNPSIPLPKLEGDTLWMLQMSPSSTNCFMMILYQKYWQN